MLDNLITDLTNPTLWLIVVGLTAFGVGYRLVLYHTGKRGGNDALDKVHGYSPERSDHLRSLHERWGLLIFLVTSVPEIGSSPTMLGVMKGVSLPIFIVLAVISYLVRMDLVVWHRKIPMGKHGWSIATEVPRPKILVLR